MTGRSRSVEETLPPGTRLEEFVIEQGLQSGGFGVTYLAQDESLGRRVAIKEYLPLEWAGRRADGSVGPRSASQAQDYEWGLARFLDEARTLARLDHGRIVRVYRVLEAWGTAYMVMEYVAGRNLEEALKAEGPWPEERVRGLLESLLPGVALVHEAGLVHRDIKPSNVMLRADGTPVLIDFGAARYAAGVHSRSLTSVLTPGYAPDEQYRTAGRQGPWTDVYALGAVAYRALSGRAPVEAPERVHAIARVGPDRDPLAPVAEASAGPVSEAFGSAVAAALAVWPEDRPQDVRAWRARWDGGVVVEPPRPIFRPSRPAPALLQRILDWNSAAGHRAAYGVAALVVAAAVAVGMVAVRRAAEAEVFRDCDFCPEMVVIPAGAFRMGLPAWEEAREEDEGPKLRVTLRSFALGVTEVTFDEWEACVRGGGCGGRRPDDEGWGRGARPVINVNWEDARAYARWLSRETGKSYRLPSEAEWEYAARGGTTTSWYWGDSSSGQCDHANGADVNSNWVKVSCDDGSAYTAAVGSYEANAFRLFDMLGNVREWVEDCWHNTYRGAPNDGTAWTRGGDCSRRVLRGGSWLSDPRSLRSGTRNWGTTGRRDFNVGFRVARTLD